MYEYWTNLLPVPELRLLLAATLVTLILVVAARLGLGILKRIAQPFLFAREMVRKLKAPAQVLLPLMGLQTVWTSASDDMAFIGPLRHVTSLAIIATFIWLGLRAVAAVQQVILVKNPVDISDNLRARRIQTQTRVLVRTLSVLVIIIGVSGMLMTFPTARQAALHRYLHDQA